MISDISNEQILYNADQYTLHYGGTYMKYLEKFHESNVTNWNTYSDGQGYIARIKFVSFFVDVIL